MARASRARAARARRRGSGSTTRATRSAATTGNVLARVRGDGAAAPLLLVGAHGHRGPGRGRASRSSRATSSAATARTVLGGDDKSGCAIICEVLRVLRDDASRTATIEVAFTICEEVGPARRQASRRERPARAEPVSCSTATRPAISSRARPASNHLTFVVHGLEAHAGMAPERGINAIQVAAEGDRRRCGSAASTTRPPPTSASSAAAARSTSSRISSAPRRGAQPRRGEARRADASTCSRRSRRLRRATASRSTAARSARASRATHRAELRRDGRARRRADRAARAARPRPLWTPRRRARPWAAAATPTC